MRTVGLALVVLAVWVPVLEAAVVHLSSFDIVNDQGTATGLLPDDWTITVANGATTADISASTTRQHGVASGGTATSFRSLLVNPESGETAYITLPAAIPYATNVAHVALSLNVAALPSGEREFLRFDEGAARGCNYRIQSDGTIKAYYDTELQATSADKLFVRHCSGAFSWVGCVVNGDCPSPATCLTSTSTYYAELEVRQVSAPGNPNQASCELWWYGRPQWLQVYDQTLVHVPGTVTNVRIGAPGSEAVALDASIDDVVIGTDAPVGHGWVGFLTPNANGVDVNGFGIDNCGAGASFWNCVDDYTSGGIVGSGTTDTLKATKINKSLSVAFSAPVTAELDGLSIPAVEWYVVARTSGSGTGTSTLRGQVKGCPGGVCTPVVPTDAAITYQTATPTPMLRVIEPLGPFGLWNATVLGDLEALATTETAPVNNGVLRVGALGIYYQGRKADVVEERNLSDHNQGTDDGKITVTMIGDSLAAGTASVHCSNDNAKLCNQDTYCSWDAAAVGGFEDKPTGGCTADVECRTCFAKRDTLNAGAGAACTAAVECPQSAGVPVGALATCNTTEGECNDNANIPCTVNADCTGWGASCDTAATCVDSCPGGSCPSSSTYGSWAKSIVGKINVDTVIVCALGGETLAGMLANRWAGILAGTDPSCAVYEGGPVTDPPDYVVVLEGANDTTVWFDPNPECDNAFSGRGSNVVGSMNGVTEAGFCRDNCTDAHRAMQCVTDTDCAAVSTSSRCIGATAVNETAANGWPCLIDETLGDVGFTACSVSSRVSGGVGCNGTADCAGAGGQSCDNPDPLSRALGFCRCATTADCLAGFACVGTFCRRTCTTDANCTTTTRTGACKDQGGGVKVCAGRCTCPCNARACTVNADCAGPRRTFGPWWSWDMRGTCVGGKCTQCGPEICRAAAPDAWVRTQNTASGEVYADEFVWMRDQLAALPDTGDGRPILIAVQHPEYFFKADNCTENGAVFNDIGLLRRGSARLETRNVRQVPTRTMFERNQYTSKFSDVVHFNVIGGDLMSDSIAAYMGTLGTCVVGVGEAAMAQRYCKSVISGTYGATCTDAATCGAQQNCALRPCTTAGDCPDAADSCRAE